MKQLRILSLVILVIVPALGMAQVASEVCLTEVRTAFKQIDAGELMKQNTATQMEYRHTYVMRADKEKKEVTAMEKRVYSSKMFLHDSPDALEISDASEAFNVRKFQYVVYRTRPTLSKAQVVPKLDPGVFDHCTVRECHFVPSPHHDTLSYKRAYMTVDEAGQKKYQVKNLEFITNPLDTTLVFLNIEFTDRSLYVKSRFEFMEMEQGVEVPGSAKAAILDGEGALKAEYKGFTLQDYR